MRFPASRTLAALLLVAAAAPAPARAQGSSPDSAVAAPGVVERIPERWKDDEGLVVGQIGGTIDLGVATWGGFGVTGVALKKQWRPLNGNGLFRGVVLFTKGEGESELRHVFGSYGAMSRQLPIERAFATKKGEITVLGLMYFRRRHSVDNSYDVLVFDNRDETIDYLRRTYPQLLAGHEGARVVLAPGDYLPMEKLVALRTALATELAQSSRRQGQFWVAGRVGTIAEVKVAGDSVRVLRFLPPVTYQEPLHTEWDAQGMLTFSSKTHRWRIVNGAVEELPTEAAGGQAARSGK